MHLHHSYGAQVTIIYESSIVLGVSGVIESLDHQPSMHPEVDGGALTGVLLRGAVVWERAGDGGPGIIASEPVEQAYVPMTSRVLLMRPPSQYEREQVQAAAGLFAARALARQEAADREFGYTGDHPGDYIVDPDDGDPGDGDPGDGDPGDEQGRKVETVNLPEEPPF
jgi:hypothetical protein